MKNKFVSKILLLITPIVFVCNSYFSSAAMFAGKEPPMEKKIILVTGSTDGIGKEAAKQLAAQGHKVIIHGRDADKATRTVTEIKAATGNSDIEFVIADLLSFREVQRMAHDIETRYHHLDVLINNAGAVFSTEHKLTVDGEERTFQLNVFSPFLLTQLLLPTLQKSKSARVIFEASAAHSVAREPDFTDMKSLKTYGAQGNYCLSKLYLIWVAQHFSKILSERGVSNITVNTTHPGMVNSQFGQGMKKGLFTDMIYWVGSFFADKPSDGAMSEVFLATSPTVEGVSGKYYSNKCQEDQPSMKYYSLENEQHIWDYCSEICKPYISTSAFL